MTATPSPGSSWRSCSPGGIQTSPAHVGEPIAAEAKQRLEDTAAHLVRNPLSLKEERKPPKHSPPSWGRWIAKVYQVDPLLCTRCGKRMSIIAFLTDQVAIGKILDHLGLSSPEADKPPPPLPELLRVAEHRDGGGVPAQWEPA